MEDLAMYIQEKSSPLDEKPDKWEKSILLLKQKMCRSHDLIQQFNDKVKECEKLRMELNTTQKDCKKITYNYNSTMAKVIKLELQNTEYKKELDILRNSVSDYEITIAANQNHIQQMMHKLEELNNDHSEKIMQYDLEKSSLRMEVDELKQKVKELTKCNKNTKSKQSKKSFGLQVDLQVIPAEKPSEKVDVGTNTIKETVVKIIKPTTLDKCLLTDEFYHLKDDPYPIFCSKCEASFNTPPIEAICRVMTQHPTMVEEVLSPSPIPVLDTNNDEPFQCSDDLPNSIPIPLRTSHENQLISDQSNTSHSLELLQKKIDKLERRFNKQKRSINTNENMYYQPYWPSPHYHPYNFFHNPLRKHNFPDPSMHYLYNNMEQSKRYNKLRLRHKIKVQSRKTKPRNDESEIPDTSFNSNWNVENIQNTLETVETPRNINQALDSLEVENDDSQHTLDKNISRSKEFLSCSDEQSSLSTSSLPEKQTDSKTNTKEKNVKDIKPQKRGGLLKKLRNLKKITTKVHTNVVKDDSSSQNCESSNHLTNDTIYSGESKNRRIAHTRKDICNDQIIDTASIRIESPTNIEICKLKKTPINDNIDKIANTEPPNSINILDSKLELKRKRGRPRLTDKENSSEMTESDLVTEIKPKRKRTSPLKSQKDSNDTCHSGIENHLNSTPRRGRSLFKNITPPKMKDWDNITLTRSKVSSSPRVKQLSQGTDCNTLPTKMTNLDFSNTNGDEKDFSPDEKTTVFNKMDLLSTEPSEPIDIVQNERDSTTDILECDDQISECENDDIQSDQCGSVGLNPIVDTESFGSILNISHKFDIPSIDDLSSTLTKSMVEDCDIERINKASNPSIENNEFSATKQTKSHDDRLMNDRAHSLPNISGLFQRKTNKLSIVKKVILKKEDAIENEIDRKPQEINEKLMTFNTSNKMTTIPISSVVQEKSVLKDNLGVKSELEPEVIQNLSDLASRYAQECLEEKTRSQGKLPVKQIINVTDDFVRRNLDELLSDDSWGIELHLSIVNKLSSTCSPRIIAKGIVKFLSTTVPWNRIIDKSHTPPAPPMTRSHQRIATLLVDMEKSTPIINIVQDLIEYQLFSLNNSVQIEVVENLVRMFVILARIKKDREKVRIFCCDAMYCLGGKTVNIIYTVLTSWPEVFPYKTKNQDFLPHCLAQLILKTSGGKMHKLIPLKNLLSNHYQYKVNAYPFENFFKDCLEALQENYSSSLMTSIILLAKRNGASWAYKNIVQAVVLPLLVNQKFPSVYRGFCLLGDIMRTMPLNDPDGRVATVVEQLNDLINSGEGSAEQQEGVVAALLSFSRHKFDAVISTILKWKPLKPLCPRTMEQLKVLVEQRPRHFMSRMQKSAVDD